MNLNRLSPFYYLNTLKGNKMMPKAAEKPKLEPHKQNFYKKWRRMSRPKMHVSFSTLRKWKVTPLGHEEGGHQDRRKA